MRASQSIEDLEEQNWRAKLARPMSGDGDIKSPLQRPQNLGRKPNLDPCKRRKDAAPGVPTDFETDERFDSAEFSD